MSATCEKSIPMTYGDSPSTTSSPGSADGRMQLELLDGLTIGPCLPEAHHVSHLAQQESSSAKKTTDTLPRTGSNWSEPSGLLSSLASRLQPQSTKTPGSMIYSMHWKQKTTPQGRLYYQLVSSAHRTSDKEFSLLAGWVTASTRDWKDSPGMATTAMNPDGTTRNRVDQLPRQAQLAGWPTPTVTDESRGVKPPRPHDTGIPLTQRVAQIDMEQPARLLPDGTILTGSSAGMESGGQLNPGMSRWLMGYPIDWDIAALAVDIRSTRSSKKRKTGSVD